MNEEDQAIAAALAALEATLGRFGAPGAPAEQDLAAIDLAQPPVRIAAAGQTAGIDEALEEPIEVLRTRLGEL